MKQKHVLAIHDISCMGRVSLTVALPVISAAGIITSVIPTAVLSTHTGEFTGYTYRDLTSDIIPVAEHWGSLPEKISFNAIYTGYLGSKEQLEIIAGLIKRFEAELIIIDPVMADHGRLYAGFGADFPAGMNRLCKNAHVITPNITEALFMLGEPYREGPYTREFIENILMRLANGRKVVLTGVHFGEKYGAAAYENGEIHFSLEDKIPGKYHGTGDLFASVLTAALVTGADLNKAADIAVKFTAASIKRTYAEGTDVKYGVNFETGLAELAGMIKEEVK